MKKILFCSLLSMCLFTSQAQDSKPEARSFGIQYGVNIGTGLSQTVLFTGWLKNFEIRGGITFSATGTDNTQDNSTPGFLSKVTNKNNSLAFAPGLSIVRHFPIKSNLDFYLGGAINVGFTIPTSNTLSSNETSYTNYYSFTSTSTKNPITMTMGLGAVGGTNFFFYKNLALGAEFSAGLSSSGTFGLKSSTVVNINTGSANSNTNNNNYTNSSNTKNLSYNLSFVGYAGLHLTYYIKTNKHKKTEAKS